MAKLRRKLMKQVEAIDKAVSNPKEKEAVLDAVQEMIKIFTLNVVELAERQTEIEEEVDEIRDFIISVEDEIMNLLMENMSAECPYCGEEIKVELNEDGELVDFECPECHNMIEVEKLIKSSVCDGNCESCGMHDEFDDDSDDFDDDFED